MAEGGVSSGAHAFGGRHSAVCGGDGGRDGGVGGVTTIVVTPLVSAESLAGRKSLVADGALVRLTSTVGDCGGGGGGGGCCRGGRRGLILAAAAAFSMAGLVSAESLVRGEGFVADRALVAQLCG